MTPREAVDILARFINHPSTSDDNEADAIEAVGVLDKLVAGMKREQPIWVVFAGHDRWFAGAFSSPDGAERFRAWVKKQHPRRHVWVEEAYLDSVLPSIEEGNVETGHARESEREGNQCD
jgi:hypothetical protein